MNHGRQRGQSRGHELVKYSIAVWCMREMFIMDTVRRHSGYNQLAVVLGIDSRS